MRPVASSRRRDRGVGHPDHAGREHLHHRQVVRRATILLASGLFNTEKQLASSIGLAVLASLAATQTEALIGSGHWTRDALTSGYGRGFLGAAICVLVALALTATLFPRLPAAGTWWTDSRELSLRFEDLVGARAVVATLVKQPHCCRHQSLTGPKEIQGRWSLPPKVLWGTMRAAPPARAVAWRPKFAATR